MAGIVETAVAARSASEVAAQSRSTPRNSIRASTLGLRGHSGATSRFRATSWTNCARALRTAFTNTRRERVAGWLNLCPPSQEESACVNPLHPYSRPWRSGNAPVRSVAPSVQSTSCRRRHGTGRASLPAPEWCRRPADPSAPGLRGRARRLARPQRGPSILLLCSKGHIPTVSCFVSEAQHLPIRTQLRDQLLQRTRQVQMDFRRHRFLSPLHGMRLGEAIPTEDSLNVLSTCGGRSLDEM